MDCFERFHFNNNGWTFARRVGLLCLVFNCVSPFVRRRRVRIRNGVCVYFVSFSHFFLVLAWRVCWRSFQRHVICECERVLGFLNCSIEVKIAHSRRVLRIIEEQYDGWGLGAAHVGKRIIIVPNDGLFCSRGVRGCNMHIVQRTIDFKHWIYNGETK